ncbi:DDB1- and CUL4-associated factor 11 isoform X1 [Theropithecus gelada]|uniref:DDB1- and CUL4-associated factor 11 isoform X1 n=1 Tax=Theropithecus gelada TaxID=9565 RepID=UPI000DC17514|nr:DDB1- and CUL4-associated factor 11 isoform X1 [Theropithecus gelada]XP_025248520.1 DDB1- and CUL4-associated factor 11 isoform X1 [Theropithecus gelada]XP_025248522.1 DDB1- and CUL4-associated factor 11 isoform X1 [Theropithecus gelada]XP_025248523.1 DDB1- and CUL4-associated factor 11 isoform X1 [Theropithecus gelada]XP_025248524.1 DDB1- and CUL4-associated factor 11 isoform X1 [Theropithecus gelada]
MGSRNSSSAGSGSGDPSEGLSRRGAGLRRSEEEEEEDEDVDLAQVLAYLLRRGQVRLVQGGGAANLQFIQALLDSEEENDRAWDGRLGDRYNPPVDATPDTRELECNEIKTQVELATGQLGLRRAAQEHSFPRMLHQRERGLCHRGSFSLGEQSRVISHFLPNDLGFTDSYSQKAFCGIYSKDGQIFMSACQDQTIRLYDCRYGRFRKFKSIKARDVGWSVLDVAFTPDGNHFLYSSWSDYIHICNIYGEGDTHTALDLRPDERRFAVFSIAVSSDGREVLGGANDGCLYVFDREQNRRTLQIESHEDDVNAVAFADISSQILFSGGDDAICKVWDRRTMREDDPKPVGALAGHQDGITFIDSKGDARYLISNSKDQTIKLWDIRRFSSREGMEASRQAATQQNWDYRWQQVPKKAWRKLKLPGDSSLMTYRGHGVLHTLIRCRFSPIHSTGQQFIYSGCSTGKVVVYDLLSGHIVKKLTNHKACVRDVSWHPFEEKIVSSSVRLQGLGVLAHVWGLDLGWGQHLLTTCHPLPCSGTGTCVCGSTARLSTSRMICQNPRNVPAPLPQCPTPLQPFPHPSRSDLQPHTG